MIKKLRYVSLIICISLITLLFQGCAGSNNSNGSSPSSPAPSNAVEKPSDSSSSAPVKKVKMTLSHSKSPDHPYGIASQMFIDGINERSNNKFEVTIFPAGQLGNNNEVLEAASLGTLDLVCTDDGLLSGLIPEFSVLGLPFMFRDTDHVFKTVNSEIGDSLAAKLESKGLKIVCWMENGFRHITNNRSPIKAPADLGGLKIRTPTTQMNVETFNALGAKSTPMAVSELYSALQLGTVDAQENPTTNIVDMKMDEVQKYVSLSGHIHTTEPLVMSMTSWNNLSPEEQKMFLEVGREVSKWSFDNSENSVQEEIKLLKEKGMLINEDVDKESFRKAVQPLYDKYGSKYSELIEKIQAVK